MRWPPPAQTEEEATVNLNRINQLAREQGRAPWSLSFSFGRSLQARTHLAGVVVLVCVRGGFWGGVGGGDGWARAGSAEQGSHRQGGKDVWRREERSKWRLPLPAGPAPPSACLRKRGACPVRSTRPAGATCQLAAHCVPAPQASVLKLWSEDQSEGRQGSAEACRAMAAALARANGLAVEGRYAGPHPSITSSQGSLRESFRGWRTDV